MTLRQLLLSFPIVMILLTALCGVGCSHEMDDWLARQRKIIARHDEVMPLMQTYIQHRARLRSMDSSQLVMATQAIDATREADDLMMQWMYQYRRVEDMIDSLSSDEMNAYLIDQQKAIDHVASYMLYADSLSKAVIGE